MKLQRVKISKIEAFPECKKITVVPAITGQQLDDFKAGQFVYVFIDIDGKTYKRCHAIASSPKDAKDHYTFWIKWYQQGFTCRYINEQWQEGQEFIISTGQHNCEVMDYDNKHIIAVGAGHAITPFLSIAHAIADGVLDKELTLIHGVDYENELIFEKEIMSIVNKTDKVKLVNLVSKEHSDKWLNGVVVTNTIKQAANNKPYTLIACGDENFYNYMDEVVKQLKLDPSCYRHGHLE